MSLAIKLESWSHTAGSLARTGLQNIRKTYLSICRKINMSDLIAKPIVNNQYWIVTDNGKKVGNIEANNAGYGLQINGNSLQFNNTEEIKKQVKIRFEPIKTNKSKVVLPYPEYPTTARTYNNIFDIQRGLHLYTKTAKSKCLHAAGYFVIDQNGIKSVIFCPKYIFIQRYPYSGPYKTETDAQDQINN
jgi:hypothetical protein